MNTLRGFPTPTPAARRPLYVQDSDLDPPPRERRRLGLFELAVGLLAVAGVVGAAAGATLSPGRAPLTAREPVVAPVRVEREQPAPAEPLEEPPAALEEPPPPPAPSIQPARPARAAARRARPAPTAPTGLDDIAARAAALSSAE